MKKIFLVLSVLIGLNAYSQTDLIWRNGQTTTPTTLGKNFLSLANPSAIRYLKINADNTISTRTAAEMLADIGAGTGNGTVTAIGVTTANGVSGTSSGGATPNLTISLGAITPTSVAASGTVTGSNLSGTNTGDQTTITGNAGSATVLQTGRTFSLTGDGTGTSSAFNGSANASIPLTLATVNSNVGTFGSATQVPVVTVNAKGLTTAVTNTSIQIAQSQVTNLVTDLSNKQGTISLTTTGTSGAATLIGNTLNIPQYSGGGGGGLNYSQVKSISNK